MTDIPVDHGLLPDAKSLLKLAQVDAVNNRGVDASRVQINYLRNQVADKVRS